MSTHIKKVEDLADLVIRELAEKPRLLVSIAGVPGAGKSTLVENVVAELRKRQILATSLPQDGFHYYRKDLEKFEDPQEAFRRRGAPFTFNAEAFIDTVGRLSRTDSTVVAPLFDHSKKDPVEDDIAIGPEVKVVFIEGNYVGLKDKPWCDLACLTHSLWFIQEDSTIVRDRLIQRHLSSGVASSLEKAIERCDGLDWQNAIYIMENTRTPDVVITIE